MTSDTCSGSSCGAVSKGSKKPTRSLSCGRRTRSAPYSNATRGNVEVRLLAESDPVAVA